MRNLIRRWRALRKPDMYHGWGKTRAFFEGWYFKMVDRPGRAALAVIPGISFPTRGVPEAFVQVLDGRGCRAFFHRFPASDFRPSPSSFALEIGPNYFSSDRMRLDLPNLRGEIEMKAPFPWPATMGAPGIMGWYAYVPFMECYHGVISMDHQLSGHLTFGERSIDFAGGRGYMEKDWGRSFPAAWIWMQSNHFDEAEGVSLMASVARIPWLGSHFIGFIVGLLFRGKLYRFTSYTGAEMRAALGDGRVELSFRDRHHRLELTAHKGPHGALVSPLEGMMTGKVNESMQGRIELSLRAGRDLLFAGTGRHAGLELAGPVDLLLCSDWRR